MPKPVCIACKRFFKPKKSGITWVENMPKQNGALQGLASPGDWKPYKLWQGDVYECAGCKTQIIQGHGVAPISEQHKSDFELMREMFNADRYQVNDC
jgi:hypothetical protein